MPETLSANTQAILLLTAPLMLGKGKSSSSGKLLKPSEYQRLARHLVEIEKQPADLLTPAAEEVIESCGDVVDPDRMRTLLARGFLLSQALDRWQSRAIWVVSRADPRYPKLLKSKLKAKAPAILYGCGNMELLWNEGLAVVGSRKVTNELMDYASRVGTLAAQAGHSVISGGARGVDRAAIDGALAAGGKVVGVLAEELEREAMHRRNREALRAGSLVLISEYDPCSRFLVGHAMQRNKLIYALAEHALVVNSDLERGGTWAGAVEQLDKFRFSNVFVRSTGPENGALDALLRRGALPWPNPVAPNGLFERLRSAAELGNLNAETVSGEQVSDTPNQDEVNTPLLNGTRPAATLYQVVVEVVLVVLKVPRTEAEVANALDVSRRQARDWLQKMSEQGLIERSGRPLRYRLAQPRLAAPNRGGA